VAYCSKQAQPLCFGDFPPGVVLPPGADPACTVGRTKRTYGDICAVASDAVDFVELVAESHPRDFVLQYDRVISFAAKRFAVPPAPYTPEFAQDPELVPADLQAWVEANLV